MRIDAPLALGLALITTRMLTGCAWLTAHGAQLEHAAADLCADLAPLADLPAGVTALGCGIADELLRDAVREAARTSPSAAPSPKLTAVHRGGVRLGHVQAHLAPRVLELLAATGDAGANR